MEKAELIKKVTDEAKKAGISEKRLNADIAFSNLPEKGKFVGYEIANPNTPMAHIRLIADDGSKVPISNLKALAFFGDKGSSTFRKVENPESPINGGYVLTGTQAVNPQLGGKMAEVVANLLDKEFESKPLDLITLAVKSDNNKVVPFKSEAEARKNLISKRFFKVTLK